MLGDAFFITVALMVTGLIALPTIVNAFGTDRDYRSGPADRDDPAFKNTRHRSRVSS